MGWVEGIVADPDEAPFGEGTLVAFRPNSRNDFHTAATGMECVSARYVFINNKRIHAFGLETS